METADGTFIVSGERSAHLTARGGYVLMFRILCGCGSFCCSYLSMAVYEDEEKRIQSRLENAWIRLSDYQSFAFRREGLILQSLLRVCTSMLDRLFGEKLMSIRAFATSTILSTMTVFIIAGIGSAIQHMAPAPSKFHDTPVALGTLGIVIIAGVSEYGLIWLCRRGWFSLLVSVFAPLIVASFMYYMIGEAQPYIRPQNHFLSGILGASLGVWLSIFSDVYAVAFLRFTLRLNITLTRMWVSLLLNLLIAAVLAMAPFAFGYSIVHVRFLHPLIAPFSIAMVETLTILNADVFVALLFIWIAAVILLVHHLLWPVIVRSIYLVQSRGVKENRKLLMSAALALAVLAFYSPSLGFALLKKLIGLL